MTEGERKSYCSGFHDVYDWLLKSPELRASFLRT